MDDMQLSEVLLHMLSTSCAAFRTKSVEGPESHIYIYMRLRWLYSLSVLRLDYIANEVAQLYSTLRLE